MKKVRNYYLNTVLNFHSNIFKNLSNFGNSVALTDSKNSINYFDLVKRADKKVARLEKKSLIFLLVSNDFESILTYIGCVRRGLVPLLLPENIDLNFLSSLINNYSPNYLFLKKSLKFNNKEFVKESDCNEYFFLRNINLKKYKLNDNLALLLSTSGSTGSPQLVRISSKNLIENTISICDSLDINKSDKPITTLPLNYTFGLSILNSHLINGCEIIVNSNSIVEKNFWNLVKEKKVTSFGGVPFTYSTLYKLGLKRINFHSISKLTQAGGKLDNSLISEFLNHCSKNKIKFYVMYGQTEATARMSCLDPKFLSSKIGSIGKAIKNGKFYLIDENGEIIKTPNSVGELCYSGPNVSMGYAEKLSDLYLDDVNKGELRTGDLAKFDSDGFYYIEGRKKRFVKVYGNRVSLDRIEKIIYEFGFECAVIGHDNKVDIFVVISEDKIKTISNLLLEKIKLNKAAFNFFSVKYIPRNESGKVLYNKFV